MPLLSIVTVVPGYSNLVYIFNNYSKYVGGTASDNLVDSTSGWAFHNTAVAYGMTKKSGESPITRYHKKEVKEKK